MIEFFLWWSLAWLACIIYWWLVEPITQNMSADWNRNLTWKAIPVSFLLWWLVISVSLFSRKHYETFEIERFENGQL